MNILITGANGQLGNCMRNVAKDSKDNYVFTDVAELDITDAEAVTKAVKDNDIKIIVNCAAYTNVEKAETDQDFAELLNAKAVRNLADAVKANDGTLIHVSTDYVFGGSLGNTPRNEEEPVNPTGVYGETKLHGERQDQRRRANYIPYEGTVIEINTFDTNNRRSSGCSQIVTVEDFDGNIANFIVSPDTYVVDMITLYEGLEVIFFYDSSLPVPLIYPPRYQAAIVTQKLEGVNVIAGYFNYILLNQEASLRLNIGANTQVVTKNNQTFLGNPANKNLIVFYGATTRSVPAQTNPDRIIVMCES